MLARFSPRRIPVRDVFTRDIDHPGRLQVVDLQRDDSYCSGDNGRGDSSSTRTLGLRSPSSFEVKWDEQKTDGMSVV